MEPSHNSTPATAAVSPPPTLVNGYQLANAIGVKPRWIFKETRAGRIPHIRAGHVPLFNLEAVRDCIARRATEIPAPRTTAANKRASELVASQPAEVVHGP